MLSRSVVSDSLQPHFATAWTAAHQAPPSMGILQAKTLEWGAMTFTRGSSQPRDRTWVSCLAGRFFTVWATKGSPRILVGSLSLLQTIFLTQESNWGFLHCRQILYQLSYQGSPTSHSLIANIVEKKNLEFIKTRHKENNRKWLVNSMA